MSNPNFMPMIGGEPISTAALEHHVKAMPPGTRVEAKHNGKWHAGIVERVIVTWGGDGVASIVFAVALHARIGTKLFGASSIRLQRKTRQLPALTNADVAKLTKRRKRR